jgi:hypothetical protein
MPKTAEPWSLTSLLEKLIKIGAKVVSHGRLVPDKGQLGFAFPPSAQLRLSDNDFSGSRNRHRHYLRSRGDKLATAIAGPPSTPPANAPPTQAATLSNRHRRQTPTPAARGFLPGGFRTPALTRADRSGRAGIRNPSP